MTLLYYCTVFCILCTKMLRLVAIRTSSFLALRPSSSPSSNVGCVALHEHVLVLVHVHPMPQFFTSLVQVHCPFLVYYLFLFCLPPSLLLTIPTILLDLTDLLDLELNLTYLLYLHTPSSPLLHSLFTLLCLFPLSTSLHLSPSIYPLLSSRLPPSISLTSTSRLIDILTFCSCMFLSFSLS